MSKTGFNSALFCKSRAGNTEINNKTDCISGCNSKFHATQRSSELWLSLYRAYEYIQVVLILTGFNSALCYNSRACNTEISNKKD